MERFLRTLTRHKEENWTQTFTVNIRCEFRCLFPHVIGGFSKQLCLYGSISESRNPESLQPEDWGPIQSRDPDPGVIRPNA